MKKAEQVGLLEDLYLVLESPYSLSGNFKELTKVARDTLGISPAHTQKYLQGEPSFTLVRRSKTVVPLQVDYTWQADLVEMQDPKLIAQNKHTRYLLTVIDVLSKYAWVIALKSKKGKGTANAFRYLLENSGGRKPVHLQTDQGKEFYNQHMTPLLDEYNIHHYSTRGEPKAAVVKRFNCMLKKIDVQVHESLQHPPVFGGLTPVGGPVQHAHSQPHSNGSGRGHCQQCLRGLEAFVQTHPCLRTLQISFGGFCAHLQISQG